jgi:pyruvyltransferase
MTTDLHGCDGLARIFRNKLPDLIEDAKIISLKSNGQHRLHWRRDRSFNFGDRLSPLIHEWLTGTVPQWVPERHPEPFLTMVGSFLEIVGPAAVVWGTGLLAEAHRPDPRIDYRAVRGPRTRQRILAVGGSCPEIYGDPVLLLPCMWPASRVEGRRFSVFGFQFSEPGQSSLLKTENRKPKTQPPRPPRSSSPRHLGIIPHFKERSLPLFAGIDDPSVLLLDITDDPLRFVRRLLRCELVATSSLHAFVAAHAYGIPAAWIQPTTLPLGDGLKFHDYLEGAGSSVPQGDRRPGSLREIIQMARRLAVLPTFDLTEFWNACPIST